MGIMKPRIWGELLADGKGENKIFKQQQATAFGGIQEQSGLYNQMVGNFSNMMAESYGRQSAVFDALQSSLAGTMSRRAGNLDDTSNWWKDPGFLPGLDQANQAAGQAGGQQLTREQLFSIRRAVADQKRAQGDEAGARAVERGERDPVAEMKAMSGYDPNLFKAQFQPRRFQAKEQAALRSQMSEEAIDAYGDAEQAFGLRAQQMGGYGPGIEAAALKDLQAQKASAQMEGQRQAILFGAQNIREDQRAFAPLRTQLQLGQAEALANEARMQNQIMMQKAAMAQQAAGQRRAIAAQQRMAGAASRQFARASGAAQRQQQQQWSASQRQRAAEFAAEMKLKGAQFGSENYFRSIGAMSGLAGMMDPNKYGALALQGLGGPMQGWGNVYNTGSQGMVNTRGSFWDKLLSGAISGGLSYATGGLSNLASGTGWTGSGGSSGPYGAGPSYTTEYNPSQWG